MFELEEQQVKLADLILLIGTNLSTSLEDRGYVVRILDSSANFSGPSTVWLGGRSGVRSPAIGGVLRRSGNPPERLILGLSVDLQEDPQDQPHHQRDHLGKLDLMQIPTELSTLIARLNQELDQTSDSASAGLAIIQSTLYQFPENTTLIQFYAALSNICFFVDSARARIQTIVEKLTLWDPAATEEAIQEAGEDLSTLLGQTLEVKIVADQIRKRLES